MSVIKVVMAGARIVRVACRDARGGRWRSPSDGAEHGVVVHVVARDGADHGALQAALGLGAFNRKKGAESGDHGEARRRGSSWSISPLRESLR